MWESRVSSRRPSGGSGRSRSDALRRAAHLCMAVAIAMFGDPALADCTLTSTGKTPLNDLGPGTYLGATGGLYPGGINTRPPAHHAAVLAHVMANVTPRNASGVPDPGGRVVLISIGMSNTTQEFGTTHPGGFLPRMNADPSRHPRLTIVDCAQGGRAVEQWIDPLDAAWTTCNARLSSAGVTAQQVQAAWIKLAERTSDVPDTTFPAHATFHRDRLGDVVRLAKLNFPNLALGVMSSRTRAYTASPTAINPEPFSYEENFSVQGLIAQQIAGASDLVYDAGIGTVMAPALVWGPMLWIDGLVPRSDGMIWECDDLIGDFIHPSNFGAEKVADQLIAFFKTDPLTEPWFVKQTLAGQPPVANLDARPAAGGAPLVVRFSANASDPDGAVMQTAWTFGDGTSSLSSEAEKVFLHPGSYPVKLTVTDDDGDTTTVSRIIVVGAVAPAVPTASVWGMLGMGGLLTLAGLRAARRFVPRRRP
jgi:PKD repeat protein